MACKVESRACVIIDLRFFRPDEDNDFAVKSVGRTCLRQPRDHPRPREANKHTFIMSAAQSAATNALLAIGAMLIVPQFTLVHPYLHLLIVAPLLVFAGCQRAALEAAKGTASQMETVSKKDAMQFPLIGSAVLFGLYVVIKFVKKEYLDMLLNVYFALLGSLSIHACVCPPLTKALGMEGLHQMHISLHWKRWKARDAEDADPIEVSFSWFDVGLYLPCAAASVAYAVTKLWWLNNLLSPATPALWVPCPDSRIRTQGSLSSRVVAR